MPLTTTTSGQAPAAPSSARTTTDLTAVAPDRPSSAHRQGLHSVPGFAQSRDGVLCASPLWHRQLCPRPSPGHRRARGRRFERGIGEATFAPDTADPELHELPQVCSHFVVDRDGTIHQLVPLHLMCRHTVGLNYTAIGIEHAGFTDHDVLTNGRQLAASVRLTTWLRCRSDIAIRKVIGHNESLSSPYHHENVAALRSQTHSDMQNAAMVIYRHQLARRRCR